MILHETSIRSAREAVPRTRGDDPGQLWEMKNVGDGKHSVNDRMRDAYHKWTRLGLDADSDTRIVITSYGATRDEDSLVEAIRNRMKDYATEVIYVLRDGSESIFLKR